MPVKQPKANKEAASQIFVKVSEIKDNCVILKDGGIRAVLSVSSVNFDLISEQEQNMIVYAYQDFINSLEFPIQILVRSRKLDIEGYLLSMEEMARKQDNPLLQQQTYGYIDFVTQLIELADIMSKEFFIIVPKDPIRAVKVNAFKKFMKSLNPADSILEYKQRLREFGTLKKTLNQRVNSISDAISRTNVHVKRLTTSELISLYYEFFNPGTADEQKVTDYTKMDLEVPPAVNTDVHEDDNN